MAAVVLLAECVMLLLAMNIAGKVDIDRVMLIKVIWLLDVVVSHSTSWGRRVRPYIVLSTRIRSLPLLVRCELLLLLCLHQYLLGVYPENIGDAFAALTCFPEVIIYTLLPGDSSRVIS